MLNLKRKVAHFRSPEAAYRMQAFGYEDVLEDLKKAGKCR